MTKMAIKKQEKVIVMKMDPYSGGGIGTKDYDTLYNKPRISGIELVGDKNFDELGLEKMTNTDLYLNNINTVGVYDCRPMTSYSAGSVSINMSINLLLYRTIEELKSINTIKFNRTDGDVGFTWYCTMWLEKVGA